MKRRISLSGLLLLLSVCGLVLVLYLLPHTRRGLDAIDRSVTRNCCDVGTIRRDDCVSRMIEIAQSPEFSYELRNRGIWTLGQLADPRALPVLEDLLGEAAPTPCRRDQEICRREVEKAIRWCQGEGWLMRWLRGFYDSPWRAAASKDR